MDPTPVVDWQPRPKFRDRTWLHVLLFLATVATTVLTGGFAYSATILAILGCHELGHYLACRYYDVDASLPFFLPMPISLTGTLGAFIRIREPIPQKRMLFDIGIAGPIAGFLVAVPALVIGVAMSTVMKMPDDFVGLELGEPLLFKLVSWIFWGTQPDGYSLNVHPIAFGAWFGLLATALNLFPIAQLDGGHIAYAVLGRRSTYVSYIALGAAVVLSFFASSWIVWTVLMIVMFSRVGIAHPPVFDEEVALDRPRQMLALFALAMLIVCFTPVPIEFKDLIKH